MTASIEVCQRWCPETARGQGHGASVVLAKVGSLDTAPASVSWRESFGPGPNDKAEVMAGHIASSPLRQLWHRVRRTADDLQLALGESGLTWSSFFELSIR
jgi:hypothetical protein